MPSRLPIRIRPAADEIAVSYLNRLATLHEIPFPELWPQVSRPRNGPPDDSTPTCLPPSPTNRASA